MLSLPWIRVCSALLSADLLSADLLSRYVRRFKASAWLNTNQEPKAIDHARALNNKSSRQGLPAGGDSQGSGVEAGLGEHVAQVDSKQLQV